MSDWVATNRPCIIKGALEAWPALDAWVSGPSALLAGGAGDARVTLALTPSGRGDAPARVAAQSTAEGLVYEPVPLTAADAARRRCACGELAGARGEAARGTRGEEAAGGKDSDAASTTGTSSGSSAGSCNDSATSTDSAASHGSSPPALWFVKPLELRVSLRTALAAVAGSRPGCFAYLSAQNDSLNAQTPALAALCGGASPFPGFADCLGSAEAANLWVGAPGTVSSAHKDHYANLHAVLWGAKVFTLCPPTDIAFLHERMLPAGTYQRQRRQVEVGGAPGCGAGDVGACTTGEAAASCAAGGSPSRAQEVGAALASVEPALHAREVAGACASGKFAPRAPAAPPDADDDESWLLDPEPSLTSPPAWRVLPDADGTRVPWLCADPTGTPGSCGAACPTPLASLASPMRVVVRRGEVLWLPPLWYHAVSHEEGAIAVNHWYPMSFEGPLWFAYQMARALAPLVEAEMGGAEA